MQSITYLSPYLVFVAITSFVPSPPVASPSIGQLLLAVAAVMVDGSSCCKGGSFLDVALHGVHVIGELCETTCKKFCKVEFRLAGSCENSHSLFPTDSKSI